VERTIVISGFGGQGLLLCGRVLAHAAMVEGREVLWIPSYGPEMRGGAATCTVILSDEPIGSPIVDRLDILVALTTPSVEKHGRLLREGSLLVADSSLVSVGPRAGIELVDIPCTQLAVAAGSDRLVSMVALGAVLARRSRVSRTAVEAALTAIVGVEHPELLAMDLTALEAGMRVAGARPAEA
jgi:2-oxoglutarate ferredoxin oxidoreductase subunit gamma